MAFGGARVHIHAAIAHRLEEAKVGQAVSRANALATPALLLILLAQFNALWLAWALPFALIALSIALLMQSTLQRSQPHAAANDAARVPCPPEETMSHSNSFALLISGDLPMRERAVLCTTRTLNLPVVILAYPGEAFAQRRRGAAGLADDYIASPCLLDPQRALEAVQAYQEKTGAIPAAAEVEAQ